MSLDKHSEYMSQYIRCHMTYIGGFPAYERTPHEHLFFFS
jgi:hypothetical protein